MHAAGRILLLIPDVPQKKHICRGLFSICREFEQKLQNRLSINRMELTVGNCYYNFAESWNTQQFRSLIQRIRTESTTISYSADYCFDNGQSNKLIKCGRYYYTAASSFRPLIAYSALGSSILYSEQESRWLFSHDMSALTYKHALANVSEILEQPEWKGHMKIDFRCPHSVDDDLLKMVTFSLKQTISQLTPWIQVPVPHDTLKCLSQEFDFKVSAHALVSIIESLQELFSLVKQSNGMSCIRMWFIPTEFLESKDTASTKYMYISMESGKFALHKFEWKSIL